MTGTSIDGAVGNATLRDVGPVDNARIAEAVSFAARAHGDQQRALTPAGTPVPYLAHLLAVAAVVADAGGSADAVVAAILHDVLEDTPTTTAEVADAFGPVVAELVVALSDGGDGDGAPASVRRERYLRQLRGAPAALALIAAADKINNIETMLACDRPGELEAADADLDDRVRFYADVLAVVSDHLTPFLRRRYAAALAAVTAGLSSDRA